MKLPGRLPWAGLAFCLGMICLGLAMGLYRFAAWHWGLAGLGLGLGLGALALEALCRLVSPTLTPALVWGSLLGGAAWALFMALLAPFSGLTWMLVPPFHYLAIMVVFCLAGVAMLVQGPWAGRWPTRPAAGSRMPGAGRLLALVFFLGLAALAALALGLKALYLDAPVTGAAGIKGLLKRPGLVLALLGLGGMTLAGLAAWRPGLAMTRVLPGLGFGLLWAGWAVGMVSAMAPVQQVFSSEALQALFLGAGLWLGIRLTRAG